MHDAQALREFAASASDEAFAALVRGHIDLVYTAALRQSRDPHLADDITQAVFIVLSKKAASISDPAVLPGWLLRTTRFAAFNAIKMESRRRQHEQKAAAMTPDLAPHDQVSELADLLPDLDEHLSKLDDKDRTAIALRFFHNLPIAEIARTMGITTDAAQKRVTRALDKLRTRFIGRGHVISAQSLAGALCAMPLLEAPSSVAAASVSMSLAPKAATIAKAALHSMLWTPAKLAAAGVAGVAGVAATVIIAAGAGALLPNSGPRPAAPRAPVVLAAALTTSSAATTTPTTADAHEQFPNILMGAISGQPAGYARGIDVTVKRTPESKPAAVVMSTDEKPSQMGGSHFLTAAAPWHNQRIRISGYIKTQDVAHWAGLAVQVFSTDGRVFAQDDMSARPITGTTDFTRYDAIVDVPPQAEQIFLGVNLYHTGKVWADGFTITPAGKDIATTGDEVFRCWSWRANNYSARPDLTVRRNGRPTILFASNGQLKTTDWAAYDRAMRDIDQFLGKRVRLTVWLKCEGVTGNAGPHLRVNGANFHKIADEGQRGRRPLRGTIDWKQYEAVADVPQDAQAIYPGITFNGAGKIWIDDLRIEVVD